MDQKVQEYNNGAPVQSEEPKSDSDVTVVSESPKWFVLRDLKRPNAKQRAYSALADMGFDVFTPMHWIVSVVKGKKRRRQVPVLYDLLFVHSDKRALDQVISTTSTLQYRYVKGGFCKPLVVPDAEMDRFIKAVSMGPTPTMYNPEDLQRLSIGKNVKIVGGALDGVNGRIVNIRGARKPRVLVEIPDLIAAVVEVDPNYVVIV